MRAYTYSDTGSYINWTGGDSLFGNGSQGQMGRDTIFKSDSAFITYFINSVDTTGQDSLVLYATNEGGSCSRWTEPGAGS